MSERWTVKPKSYYDGPVETLEHRFDWIDCAQCGVLRDLRGGPPSCRGFCSRECEHTWNDDHPEEAAKWIRVEDMTIAQGAELAALLGFHAGQA